LFYVRFTFAFTAAGRGGVPGSGDVFEKEELT